MVICIGPATLLKGTFQGTATANSLGDLGQVTLIQSLASLMIMTWRDLALKLRPPVLSQGPNSLASVPKRDRCLS